MSEFLSSSIGIILINLVILLIVMPLKKEKVIKLADKLENLAKKIENKEEDTVDIINNFDTEESTINYTEVIEYEDTEEEEVEVKKVKKSKKLYKEPILELLNDSEYSSGKTINNYAYIIGEILRELKIDIVRTDIKSSKISINYIYEFGNTIIQPIVFSKLEKILQYKIGANVKLNKCYGESTFAIEYIKTDESRYINIKDVLEINRDIELPLYIGINTNNDKCIIDLSKAPHVLIGGQTGGGKSVAISTIITSLIYNKRPDELELILIDKKNELSLFNNLPHLKYNCINNNEEIVETLYLIENEMRVRNKRITEGGYRNIKEFNTYEEAKMPYMVCIIDELQDLYNKEIKKEVEHLLNTISAIGRASGIHLIVATQRPSAKLLSGELKANLPTKISFATSNATDSRVILDSNGAETLIGNGDALLKRKESIKLERLQVANITTEEIKRVIDYIK